MRWRFQLPILCGLLWLSACKPEPLERQGVPLIGGVEWGSVQDTAQLARNVAEFRKYGIQDVMISLPLVADTGSQALPAMPLVASVLEALSRRMQVQGMRLHLALVSHNERQLFPNGKPSDVGSWFERLQSICDTLLSRSQAQRLVVGTDLGWVEEEGDHWCAWAEGLRKKHHVPVSYSCSMEEMDSLSFLKCMDELSLSWTPPGDGNPVAYCRDWNFKAGQLAIKLDKPVFIFQPNLLGKDPGEEFSMRLQFWPKEVKLTGFHLNTLYSRSVFLDSTSYYGLAHKAEFLDQLAAYSSQSSKR